MSKQMIVKPGSVFRCKLSSKKHSEKFKKEQIIEVDGISASNILNPGEKEKVKLKVLHVTSERGLIVKKRRRKRYQRKIGYRTSVLTLKFLEN